MFEPEKKTYKMAVETTDKPYLEQDLFLRFNDPNVIDQRVFFNDEKDMAAHWSVHETTLWIIIIVCCLYFLIILSG